jgi:hypothetical protein
VAVRANASFPTARYRRELRPLLASALGLGLVAVAGLAAGASPWRRGGGGWDAPGALVEAVAALAGVAAVVGVLALWTATPAQPARQKKIRVFASDDQFDEFGSSLLASAKLVAVVLAVFALLTLAALPLLARSSENGRPAVTSSRSHAPTTVSGARPGPARSVDVAWVVVPVVVTLVLLGPAALVIRRRRFRRDGATAEDESESLRAAVRLSIATLEECEDPRVAIIGAYSMMEQRLADLEVSRASDETPGEFLERILRQPQVSAGAAREVTERFEEVRFSDHPIGEAERRRTLEALRRVASELQGR